MCVNQRRLKLKRTHNILIFVDGANKIGANVYTTRDKTEGWISSSKEFRLEVSSGEEKWENMIASRI
jgi:hypothetical protein